MPLTSTRRTRAAIRSRSMRWCSWATSGRCPRTRSLAAATAGRCSPPVRTAPCRGRLPMCGVARQDGLKTGAPTAPGARRRWHHGCAQPVDSAIVERTRGRASLRTMDVCAGATTGAAPLRLSEVSSRNRHARSLDCCGSPPHTMTTTTIAPDQSEVLLRVIEAAPQVCRRHQFFVWTQGDFQRGRGQAVVLDIRQLPGHDALVSELVALGYGRFIVHGLTRPGRPDEVESVFLFGQPGPDADDNARQALDMLLPCVHLAYQRVCVTERQMSQSRTGASSSVNGVALRPSPITEREREILVWVRDGLSNQQISEKLGISALTVKNHVQKILRKLRAANRSQAVAKAMSMNALGAANFHLGESSV